MSWGKPTVRAVLVVAGIVGAASLWAAMRREASFERQKLLESVTYYRFKTTYVVKATGEAVNFDYVAACAVVETTYKDGDRSMDTLGVNPKTFIKATKDGHAIQVWTPEACQGEIKKGWIPPDLFPFAIYYDDVSDMSFGWGYASQDAYDGPLAEMSFEGPATIEAVTYADWKAWRTKTEAEFRPVGKILSPWGYSYEDQGLNTGIAVDCSYYKKLPVLDSASKAIITEEWVKRGRPEFWTYDNSMLDRLSNGPIWAGNKYYDASSDEPRTKTGGIGTISLFARHKVDTEVYKRQYDVNPSEIYPLLPPWYVRKIYPDENFPNNIVMIAFNHRYLGFVACGARGDDKIRFKDMYGNNYIKSVIVNKQRQSDKANYRLFINNIEINRSDYFSDISFFPETIFHNDEYSLTSYGNWPYGVFR